MELRHLRYFVAVAEERGITRAAARLNVSQPPLSRQIRDLEHELGVRLLDRGPREAVPTAAGRAFLRDARDILRRVDAAARRAAATGGDDAGSVRVAYAPSPTVEFLPRVLGEFRRRHPRVRVTLLDVSTDEMLAGLRARTMDVALVALPPAGEADGLRFGPLFGMPIGMVVAPGHPLVRRKSVTLEEAMRQPLVAFERAGYSDYHDWLRRASRLARRKPNTVATADGSASLMTAVCAGQGIAFGPRTFVTVSGGRVRFVPIEPACPPLTVGYLVRKGAMRPQVEAFVGVLRSCAGDGPGA